MKYLLTNVETDRLKFRKLENADFETWLELFKDEYASKMLGMDEYKTPYHRCEKWFEWTGANAVTGFYDGNWHHLAFVYDANTSKMTLYKDGVAHAFVSEWTGHGNVSLEPNQITGLKIGAGPQEFTTAQVAAGSDHWLKNSWTGGIDQFRMYTSALTSSEVNALYTKKR